MCCFIFIKIQAQYLNPNDYPLITEPKISLKSNDHNSEGFLVTWNNVVYHFFRQDPSYFGNHINNSGRIMMRKSFDNGDTWTTPEVIFDSQFDDRNIHGGITEDGRIILTFRQYDAFQQQHIQYNVMYSDDFGQTWNGPISIPTEAACSGTHQIFGNNIMGYYNIIYSEKYCELRHSPNGIQWDSIVYVWDYRLNNLYNISEASFVYLGSGIMIGLFRNDSNVLGENFLQVESYDYGQTWTEPALTNIANGFFCPSPWIFYDYEYDHVWIIAIDRRGNFGPLYTHDMSNIWLYKSYPNEILGNTQNYTPFLVFPRPTPSFYRIYGYPASTKTPDGNYLVIFTESEYRNKGEWAYLYQFNIKYKNGALISVNQKMHNHSSLKVYPDPAMDVINIVGKIEKSFEPLSLRIYNSIGQMVYYDNALSRFDGSFCFHLNIESFSTGLYRCIIKTGNEVSTTSFIKT